MSKARQARKPQRWPDIMIGVLTLALLGGFGALLLDGRKPAPAAPVAVQPPASVPVSPGTVPPPAAVEPQPAPETAVPETTATPETSTAPSATSPSTPTAPAATPPATSSAPEAASTPTQPAPSSSGVAQTGTIPPVPKAPEVPPITPPVVPPVTPPAASAPATATPATQAPTSQTPANQPPAASTSTQPQATAPISQPEAQQPAPTGVAPRAGGAVATSENRVPLRSDYRISLGSFSTRKTVETQTAAVRALGYTVYPIDIGGEYVAQVGPFADEAMARQALADIQRAFSGALLYRPRAKATTTETSSSEPDTSTATTTRPAPDGPRYLQVGAFDRAESAQRLVGILRDQNFAPTVSSPPDGKTTVMVGPYSGDALLRAEARLDNAGLEHFRVK